MKQATLIEERSPRSVQKDAVMDDSGFYRYWLSRRWGAATRDPWNRASPYVLWVMLNPSTADADHDDPTIRRCIGFTRHWGHDALGVVNLFAWRATDPTDLLSSPDPIGLENDAWIKDMARTAAIIVLAWGAGAGRPRIRGLCRDQRVLELMEPWKDRWRTLGFTKNENEPRHPLFVSGDQPLREWDRG